MDVTSPRILSGCLLALLATGCASATPQFDQQFGQTVPVLRAQQIANPDAPLKNQARSVDGIDGRAGREAIDRYYRSFQEPPKQPNVFTIGIGGGDSLGGGGNSGGGGSR